MIKQFIRSIIRKLGYDIVKYKIKDERSFPPDFGKLHKEIITRVNPYTMTSPERIHALIESTIFVLQNDIPGDFVECGVYKGGSMMAVAITLVEVGVKNKELYLYDTFECRMPAPEEKDVDLYGNRAIDVWGNRAIDGFSQKKFSEVNSTWADISLESVKEAMNLTGYPIDRIHFVKGRVEDTIPKNAPESIALLRLDTDWYQSTKYELTHLYPRVSPKGIIIMDDYGHFKGSREAVDEFFMENNLTPFLHRIDYTGRLMVKDY